MKVLLLHAAHKPYELTVIIMYLKLQTVVYPSSDTKPEMSAKHVQCTLYKQYNQCTLRHAMNKSTLLSMAS